MRRLGKLPPRVDPRTLAWERYAGLDLPVPAALDRAASVKHWPMYANDRLEDCTCAAAAHMVQAWTAAALGRATILPWRAVEAAYFTIGGGRDRGAACLDVLNFWRTHGIAGDRIGAFARLRDRDVLAAKQAIDLFGAAYLGFALPTFAIASRRRWELPPGGAVGANRPRERNGHCVPAIAYDATHAYVVTWGRRKALSWDFYRAYMDEAYAVLSRDWIAPDRRAPSGFDLGALKADLARL